MLHSYGSLGLRNAVIKFYFRLSELAWGSRRNIFFLNWWGWGHPLGPGKLITQVYRAVYYRSKDRELGARAG